MVFSVFSKSTKIKMKRKTEGIRKNGHSSVAFVGVVVVRCVNFFRVLLKVRKNVSRKVVFQVFHWCVFFGVFIVLSIFG